MKKIFLYGFYGIENAGNEAMLRAFTKRVREHIPDAHFILPIRHPSKQYDETYGVETCPNLEYATRDEAAGRWLRGLNPDDSPEFLKFINRIKGCDLVVIGPGQYLVETGENGLLKGALAQFAAVVCGARIMKVPCFGLGMACESLQSDWGKLLIGALLPGMDGLTFRDQRSVENLREIGVEITDAKVLGDVALLGEPAPANLGEEAMMRNGVPPKKGPRLAFAPRNIYWKGIDQEELRERIAKCLSLWLKEAGRDVLVVSQNRYAVDNDRDDDSAEMHRILRFVDVASRARIHLIEEKLLPEELESLYGHCDVTLSERLHGAVFSTKQGTPPVMLSFMDKSIGYFNRIGQPDCLIDLHASAKDISEKLEKTLADRERLSAKILDAVAHNRKTAQGYVTEAVKLIQQSG